MGETFEHTKKLRRFIKNYEELDTNLKDWFSVVGNRLRWDVSDMRTYFTLIRSGKDMRYLESLNLKVNMSYYVVASKREYLEKFRVYYQVHGPKRQSDYIAFTNKVYLETYTKQITNDDFNIDSMIVSNMRLLVYCHKNNYFVSEKQSTWVQGSLLTSDICNRLLSDNKLLILAEYDVNELNTIVDQFELAKIEIKDTDMEFNGLYNKQSSASEKKDICDRELG